MRLPLGRALVTGGLGALMGALFLALFHGAAPSLRLGFDGHLPQLLVKGVHPPERDQATGLTFAWTHGEMALRLPGLDRSVDWIMDVRVRAGRPDPADNPDLMFYVDGVLVMTRAAETDFEEVRVIIPAEPGRRRGASISMRSSSTFVPGHDDWRALGVLLDSIALTPAGIVLPPRRAFGGAASAAGAFGAAVALVGVTPLAAAGAAVLVSAAIASQVARGFGPHTDYPLRTLMASLLVGALLVIAARLMERLQGETLRNTARFAAAFSAGALLLKLLMILHPNLPIGEASFHAEGFQRVLAETVSTVARGPADMVGLRVVALSVDALAALALYLMAVRHWNDRTAGAIAVALSHLIPIEFRVIAGGTFTNALVPSIAVLALGLMVSGRVRLDRFGPTAALAAVLAAAFVSHTSTFPLLLLAAVLAGILYAVRGGPLLRSSALAVLLAAIGALVLAVVLSRLHVGEAYLAGFAGMPATHLGWPSLLLAGFGAWRLWQQGARDPLTLALAGWALSYLVCIGAGLLTPVDMGYFLAATPAVALAGAFGASQLWSARGHHRGMAVVLMAWAVRLGTLSWWRTI